MKIETLDPMTLNDVADVNNAPYVIEGEGDKAIKLYFESEANNMILCRDIEVYSLCEHHMLPFFGSCTIGYIAKHHVIGVSKLARIVDHFSRRLQIQERLTAQIANAVNEAVDAVGVGVIIEAKHMCMIMRGVEKQHSSMTTSSVLGRFQTDPSTRNEFLALAGK